MTNPEVAILMLALFIVLVLLGFPIAFTLLAMGVGFGYYAYYPFDFVDRTYLRAGLKRYFGDKWFAALTLKSHAAKAEAVELGIGIRL
jgi:TRAP-type mannitol/chloroaromatic compound transport system permease large subunit